MSYDNFEFNHLFNHSAMQLPNSIYSGKKHFARRKQKSLKIVRSCKMFSIYIYTALDLINYLIKNDIKTTKYTTTALTVKN